MGLQSELAGMAGNGVDMAQLEEAFIVAAAEYGVRRSITYAAWRDAGVPPHARLPQL